MKAGTSLIIALIAFVVGAVILYFMQPKERHSNEFLDKAREAKSEKARAKMKIEQEQEQNEKAI